MYEKETEISDVALESIERRRVAGGEDPLGD